MHVISSLGNDLIIDKLEGEGLVDESFVKSSQISLSQAIFLIIVALSITLHVEVVPELFHVAGRDAWVSVLLLLPLVILIWWAFIAVARLFLTRAPLASVNPRWLRWVLIVLVEVYIILSIIKSLKLWASFSTIAFLPGAPPNLLALLLLMACVWIARNGLYTVAVTIGFLVPFIFFFGITNSLTTIPMKDYGLVLPIWEHGITPTIRGLLTLLPNFGDFFFILFIAQFIENNTRLSFRPWLITNLVIFYIAIGVVIGLLAEFGPQEITHLRFPAFEGWRLVTLGPAFERIDFIAIFQWTTGLAGRIMFLLTIGSGIFGGKIMSQITIYLLSALILLGCLVPLNPAQMHQFSAFLGMYALFIQATITIVLLFVAMHLKKNAEGALEHA